jgi:hypothetical protein
VGGFSFWGFKVHPGNQGGRQLSSPLDAASFWGGTNQEDKARVLDSCDTSDVICIANKLSQTQVYRELSFLVILSTTVLSSRTTASEVPLVHGLLQQTVGRQ